ncbi:MAG: hypothetical protein WDN49_08745 [Acetobacteraceae bacterium]
MTAGMHGRMLRRRSPGCASACRPLSSGSAATAAAATCTSSPWFVLIGPPGSGKTTALLNSGLHFPLAQEDGSDAAVGGVGGTRLCDWWFADEAVLIDTAGRYTTLWRPAPARPGGGAARPRCRANFRTAAREVYGL